MASGHNQQLDYLNREKQVEQVTRGGYFHSLCFFLLDERQVVCKASCTAVRAQEVNYLTQSKRKQEAVILRNT